MTMQFVSSVSMVESALERYPQMLADNPQLRVIATDLSKKLRDALEATAPDCDPVAMPCTAQCDKACAALPKSEERIFDVDGIKFRITRVGAVMQISIIGKQVEPASIDLLVAGIFRDLHNAWKQMGNGT